MAVEWKTEHTRSSVYFFHPEDIVIRPELNGRHDLPDVGWLIEDILKRGQLQPVTVRNDGGQPVLVAGFSRWRAVSEINKRGLAPAKVKIACSIFRGSETEAFLANIAENNVRNSTTAMDDAHNIARLERYGMTITDISAVYRQSEAWCRQRLALMDLSEESRAALRDGKLKPTAAVAIAKLSEEQQHNALANGKVSVADAAAANGKPRKPAVKDIRAEFVSYRETGHIRGIKVPPEAEQTVDLIIEKLAEWIEGKA